MNINNIIGYVFIVSESDTITISQADRDIAIRELETEYGYVIEDIKDIKEILRDKVVGYNFIDDYINQYILIADYDSAIKIAKDNNLSWDRVIPLCEGEIILEM